MEKIYHPYHLVNPSPWPFCMSLSVLYLTLNTVSYFHLGMLKPLFISFILIIIFMVIWFKDIHMESNIEGFHTKMVFWGLKMGFMLFMVSEVLFFFSFFWAFFHSSLSPSIEIGAMWPPLGINALDPFSVPLLNTAMLLSSGATVTWAHHGLVSGKKSETIMGLVLTLMLGVMFTSLQALEYYQAPFSMADSVYGSIFFVTTGFHGLHVLIGTMFLSVCLFKVFNSHFTTTRHFTFEAASWYWHFVDVVWLFLYMFVYLWLY